MKWDELEETRERLEEFLAQVLFPACERSQQRKWGGTYVRGLLLDGERKSAGAMAVRLPDGNEQALQQFVTDSKWEFRTVRQRLAQRLEALLPANGVYVVDDTGFPKKGTHSVGVARQYSGSLGKVGNCQIGVSLHYSTPAGSLPLDWELYLPQAWVDDPERCRKAGVPAATAYQPKWQLALGMLDRICRQWKLQDHPVVKGSGFGSITPFRDGLTERRLPYVVGIQKEMSVWLGDVPAQEPDRNPRGRPRTRYDYGNARPASVKSVAQGLVAGDWQNVTWDQGSKGALASRFAAVRVHPSHGNYEGRPPRPEEWLVVEWPESEPEPTNYWLSTLPEDVPICELVRLAKMRWHVEQDYQQLKEELGLDHHEGRKWIGWHRHVTLSTVAFAFLLLEQRRGQKGGRI